LLEKGVSSTDAGSLLQPPYHGFALVPNRCVIVLHLGIGSLLAHVITQETALTTAAGSAEAVVLLLLLLPALLLLLLPILLLPLLLIRRV
jgi:hypothetical protein